MKTSPDFNISLESFIGVDYSFLSIVEFKIVADFAPET